MAGNTKDVFVIDASFALSFLIPDEKKEFVVERFRDFIQEKSQFVSTVIFKYEVTNGLLLALRRNRIAKDEFDSLLQSFNELRILIEDLDIFTVVETALKDDLTSYDATYISLSKQLQVPLLTLDQKLQRL